MVNRTNIIEIITILNIILFFYTGVAKIMDYGVFKDQLASSPLLSWGATTIAVLLPWIELAIILMLIIPRWRLKGLYASTIIMTHSIKLQHYYALQLWWDYGGTFLEATPRSQRIVYSHDQLGYTSAQKAKSTIKKTLKQSKRTKRV